MKSAEAVRPKNHLSAAIALLLYGFSFGIAIPAFPAITLSICDGDSALSARYYGIGMFIRYAVEFVASPFTERWQMSSVGSRSSCSAFCISIEYFVLAVTPTYSLCSFVARCRAWDSGLPQPMRLSLTSQHLTTTKLPLNSTADCYYCGELLGGLSGGILADINPRLCLGISGIVSTIALLMVMCTCKRRWICPPARTPHHASYTCARGCIRRKRLCRRRLRSRMMWVSRRRQRPPQYCRGSGSSSSSAAAAAAAAAVPVITMTRKDLRQQTFVALNASSGVQ